MLGRARVVKPAPKSPRSYSFIPMVDPDDITIGPLLGKGCYGEVYSGECRSIEVAIKIPKVQKLSTRVLEKFAQEVEMMR
jgi:serine/threonine protein kinase